MGDRVYNSTNAPVKLIDLGDGSYAVAIALTESRVENAFAITADDANDLAYATTAIYVGVEGDVKVDMAGEGTGIVLKGLAAGMWHPIAVTKVYATGTTATDILGAY